MWELLGAQAIQTLHRITQYNCEEQALIWERTRRRTFACAWLSVVLKTIIQLHHRDGWVRMQHKQHDNNAQVWVSLKW